MEEDIHKNSRQNNREQKHEDPDRMLVGPFRLFGRHRHDYKNIVSSLRAPTDTMLNFAPLSCASFCR